jgi:hypothetical protein
MNFIKTFLLTLVIYIGLNAVFLVVSIFISPGFPLSDIFFVISTLFSPIVNTPGTTFMIAGALITSFNLVAFLSFLALFVPPLVTVIIGARLGDTGKISFLSWLGTAMLSCIVYYLFLILGASPLLGATWVSLQFLYGIIGATLYVVIGGIVNAFFYGCFSFLFGKKGL